MDKDLHLIEAEVSSETVFHGALLNVRRDVVALPNGNQSVREYVVHPGAVVVLAFLDNGNLLFERQFRYPLRQVFLELPAGKIDPGENILETAKRELSEETGYTATDWRHLGLTHPCVGYSNERIEIFLAQGLVKENAQHLDHGEFVELFTLSLDEALNSVRSGEINDSKTIASLFWAEKVLRNGW